jgi:hypothetical protein
MLELCNLLGIVSDMTICRAHPEFIILVMSDRRKLLTDQVTLFTAIFEIRFEDQHETRERFYERYQDT